jgi:subtilisin family serine protease
MRNWHHKVIKLDKARNYITVHNQNLAPDKKINNLGNSNIHVGIIESGYMIEFKSVSNNNSTSLDLNQYKASHYCFDDLEGTRKVIFRKQDEQNKSIFTEDILIGNVKDLLENHTTSTAGIVAANKNNEVKIEGICPNVRIINSQNFSDVPIQTLVNTKTSKNIESYYYKKKIIQKLPENQVPSTAHYENSTGILKKYSEKYASIINISAPELLSMSDSDYNLREAVDFKEFHRAGTNFILSDLLAYARDGRGCLVVNSAGNDELLMDENSRALASSKKPLVVSASKLDPSQLLQDIANNLNPDTDTYVFKEDKAAYSSYGPRVDLCAPSSATAIPEPSDFSIHAPSMITGGNIDINSNYVSLVFVNKDPAAKIITVSKNNILLPGQCIEFGTKESFFYDIRYITEISHSGNSSVITLNSPLVYTQSINLSNKVRVLVYKKNVTRGNDNGSVNRLSIDNNKGLQKNQDVYIYDPSNINNGINTKIVLIDSSQNKINLQNSIASLPLNKPLILVPAQMNLDINRTNNKTYSANSEDSRGYFQGQMVNFSIPDLSLFINLTKKKGTYLYTNFIDIDSPVANIKSLSYGDYYSKFGGTSAAAPIVSGVAALVLSANPDLNAIEIKHILKETADTITGSNNYKFQEDILKYNYKYKIHEITVADKKCNYFGAGRVNAERAVEMAINWNTAQKPRMGFPNKQNPAVPDIWVSEQTGVIPSIANPYQTLETRKNQNIYVRVKNTGNRHSFQETDLRVLVAFTSEATPVFKFPECWYQNTTSDTMKTVLLDVQEIKPIASGAESVLTITWENISEIWTKHNPEGKLDTYLLAHIAPFDGLTDELSPSNASLNKNLMFRKITATHSANNAVGTSGNRVSISDHATKYDLMATAQSSNKKFSFDNFNIPSAVLDTMEFKFSLYNRQTNALEQEVIFKKNNGVWAPNITPGNWINITMNITDSTIYNNTYKNALLSYEFNYDNNAKEIKFNVKNA